MKASHRLERGYGTLTASERFRLLVGAEARTDPAEVERLLRSCPRLTVSLRDPAFSERLERAFRLTTAVILALEAIEGKLNVLAACDLAARWLFAVAADEVEYEVFCLDEEFQPPLRRTVRRQRSRFRNIVRELRSTFRTEGATLAHAFAAVCRDELEVDLRDLIAIFVHDAADADIFERFIALSPDGEAVEALRRELSGQTGASEQLETEERS